MAITIQRQAKKQRNLVFVFLGLLVVLLFVVFGANYFQQEETEEIIRGFSKITINFSVLDNPLLKELVPIKQISGYEGEIGRENPFLSP